MRLRFSLRSAFIVMALAAILLSLLARDLAFWREQYAIRQEFEADGARFKSTSPAPWHRLLTMFCSDKDYFCPIVEVDFFKGYNRRDGWKEKSLERIADLEYLEVIYFADEDDPRWLDRWQRLQRLRVLKLGSRGDIEDDRVLVWSAQFPALEVLQIYHSGITDDGLAHLQELHHLRILTLFSSSKISSGGMKWLRHLPLQEIDLSQTAIDDDAARVIREIGTLNRLELFGTAITDKSLQVFAQMPQLKVLDVTGTRVSRMGVKQLRALRPDLTVFCSEQSL